MVFTRTASSMCPMLRRAVTAVSTVPMGSANNSEMRILSRWLSCTSLSYVRVSRSCSIFESVDTGNARALTHFLQRPAVSQTQRAQKTPERGMPRFHVHIESLFRYVGYIVVLNRTTFRVSNPRGGRFPFGITARSSDIDSCEAYIGHVTGQPFDERLCAKIAI